VRALELAEAGSSLVPDDDRLWASATRHPTVIVGLDVPSDELERRIVARTDAMFDAGVVEEVRAALAAGVSHTAAKALGLHEIATLPEPEARERIIIRTRRYAAYQRKWMRRIPGLVPIDGTLSAELAADAVLAAASINP
jgi:tRNA dimethylallyltransferase